MLISIPSPWSFTVWGIDLTGQLPNGKGRVQYVVVVVDYFSKWVKAEALASNTPVKIRKFIYKKISCQYKIPYNVVSDNETQFDCKEFKEFCDDL